MDGLAETARLTELLFEQAGVGLCLVGPGGEVLRANAEWLRSTGLREDQVIGRDVVDLFPETRELALALHRRAREGHPVRVPRHAQRVGGRDTWWEGRIAPIPMEGGTGLLITAREMSDEHALLASIVEQLPAGAVIAEAPSGRIVLGNAEVERIFGHGVLPSRSTAEYARWKAFHPGGAQLESHEHPLARALGGATVTGEAVEIQRADGRRALLSVNAAPIRDAQGAIRAAVVVFTDVTERRRAEDALRRAEAVLRHASAMARLGAWWIEISEGDLNASPLCWSDEVYRIFGYEPGEVEVTNALFFEHVHPADRQRVADAVARAAVSRQPYAVEHRILPRGGAERVVLEYGAFEFDLGAPVRLVGAVQDVTDLKRTEAALREADRRKDEYLGMLSHEIRNPLAPICNSVFILERADPGSEQAKRAVAVIHRQAEHLTRLVDDLLDVTRVARGKIELRPSRIDLREVVSRAAEDSRLVLEERGVRFTVSLPAAALWTIADPTRLTQVVGNLLHNAAKFTRGGDEVALALLGRPGEAELRVRDTGVGISAALLPHVFEPFVQGESTLERTEGGLGLGLALVKGIAELHGGSVRAESGGKGRGAELVVRLPVRDVPAPG